MYKRLCKNKLSQLLFYLCVNKIILNFLCTILEILILCYEIARFVESELNSTNLKQVVPCSILRVNYWGFPGKNCILLTAVNYAYFGHLFGHIWT